jgi:hypothetical protein
VDVDGDGVSLGGYFTRLEPPTLPSATVVPFASLTPAFQGFTQADSAEVADAIPVQVAVAAAKPQARDKVRVALVRTHEKDGAHQLAWVVELNAGSSNQVSLRSQHLVDAATGELFGVAVP